MAEAKNCVLVGSRGYGYADGANDFYGIGRSCRTGAESDPGAHPHGLSACPKAGQTARPTPGFIVDREKVRELYKAGQSTRMIAVAMGLTKSTVFNIVNVN